MSELLSECPECHRRTAGDYCAWCGHPMSTTAARETEIRRAREARELSENCYNHPDRKATGMCVSCHRLVCPECTTVLDEKIYCMPCADELFKRSSQPRYQAADLNWFQRHLNWSWLLISFVASIVIGISLGLIVAFADPYGLYISDTALDWISYFIGIAISMGVGIWVLDRKGRSFWWLLIFFVPFGWIIFLCLENRRRVD